MAEFDGIIEEFMNVRKTISTIETDETQVRRIRSLGAKGFAFFRLCITQAMAVQMMLAISEVGTALDEAPPTDVEARFYG